MPTAREALDELLEMSSSIRHAVIVRGDNEVLASTFASSAAEAAMVRQARAMIDEARAAVGEMGRSPLTQIFVEAKSGCVFVALGERDTWLAATTGTEPTVGLVLYDVNTALRTALEGEAAEGGK
ncbi:MAG: roadblock/LC7 domain-containing protein [Thermoleophilia bacterium]|nr:roadblock/LC7 domain-containing protein [Thermoleophilia bacterium]